MDDPWIILGLDGPTTDLRAIKKAYALKLKETRPEDDSEGFLNLRNAFEFAKSFKNSSSAPVFSSASLPQSQPLDFQPDSSFEVNEELPGTTPVMPGAYASMNWRDKIGTILNDPSKRTDVENWEEVFDHDALASLDEFMDFEEALKESLLDFYGYNNRSKTEEQSIPVTIGKYIFARMDWPLYVNQNVLEDEAIGFLSMAIFSGQIPRKAGIDEIKQEIEVSESKVSGPIFEALVRVGLLGAGFYLIILAFDGVESREQAMSILVPASIILILLYLLIRTILWMVRSRW